MNVFAFGKNWETFLSTFSPEALNQASSSLQGFFGKQEFRGTSFLDVGCGSGIFSLAARKLGARVLSFDLDPDSVRCAEHLRITFAESPDSWQIKQGSILDREFIDTLGEFDYVYSWGVLHHTGSMLQAFANIAPLVRAGGCLFISIYNDQGVMSQIWKWIKLTFNRLPPRFRFLVLYPCFAHLWAPIFLRDFLFKGQPGHTWKTYVRRRGMSPWTDVIDWVGGYPFEVAKPEEVFDFFRKRGFTLERLKTVGGRLGCNEFVFRRLS